MAEVPARGEGDGGGAAGCCNRGTPRPSIPSRLRCDAGSLANIRLQANALAPNWGPTIFQSAHEIAANTKLRQSLGEIQAQTESEKQWWEKRRGQIQGEFMKELDDSEKNSAKGASEDDAVLVDTPSKPGKGGKGGKKGKK